MTSDIVYGTVLIGIVFLLTFIIMKEIIQFKNIFMFLVTAIILLGFDIIMLYFAITMMCENI